MADEAKAAGDEFRAAVDMTSQAAAAWLETEESRAVGQKDDGGGSIGPESGRRIVEVLGTKPGDLGEEDDAQMRRVVGDVHRHLAPRPDGDVTGTGWRSSLSNWGHDLLEGSAGCRQAVG